MDHLIIEIILVIIVIAVFALDRLNGMLKSGYKIYTLERYILPLAKRSELEDLYIVKDSGLLLPSLIGTSEEIAHKYKEFLKKEYIQPIEKQEYGRLFSLSYYKSKKHRKISFRRIKREDFTAITFLEYMNKAEGISHVDFSNPPYYVSPQNVLNKYQKKLLLWRRLAFQILDEHSVSYASYVVYSLKYVL